MDIFKNAAINKYRYPSSKGNLTTEDLFDLPLTSEKNASLDSVARELNKQIKEFGEESFVNAPSPALNITKNKLEVVKLVIAFRQEMNEAAATRMANNTRRAMLTQALHTAEAAKLSAMSPEEIRAELDKLK